MQETYIEFTFEAAHQTPPFSGLHGHSFKAQVFLRGTPDPVYGWSHNLFDVEPVIDSLRKRVDQKYLNEVDGLSVPTLENLTKWIWHQLDGAIPGVDRVIVSRRAQGGDEGCVYSARNLA